MKKGFTLVEVLITLGIIGIVAVLTLPTLVTNIQTKQKEARIKNITSKIGQATDTLVALDEMNGHSTTMEFVDALQKHLKILDI